MQRKLNLEQLANERKLTADDLHAQFESERSRFPDKTWTLAVFEGSPARGLYSWCPDCVVASAHIKNFEKLGRMKLLQFKVGSRREWESKKNLNPFKAKFPYLSDIPTAILFMGRLDVFRIVAPQESDLLAMRKRIEAYKQQIRRKEWRPPIRGRGGP